MHLRRHDIALLERAVEQHARRLIGDRALDGPAQRPRAVHGVIPRGQERIERRVRHLQLHARALHARVDRVEELLRDLADVGARELVKDDDVVDAVEKLRPKRLFQVGHDHAADLGVRAPGALARLLREAEAAAAVRDGLCADVRGHDDDGVAEVHLPPERIRELAVLHDLQQEVEHVLVRLFDLVEQHNGIRLAAHLFRELAALLVADIARGRADEPRDAVPLHIFRHVHADERLLVAEERLGQRAAELRLPDAGRAEEQKAADRAVRVAETDAAAADRVRDRVHCLLLPDDAAAQRRLHLQQLLALARGDARDGDTRPERNDLGHVLARHGAHGAGVRLLPLTAQLLELRAQLLLAVAQAGRALEILRAHGVFHIRGRVRQLHLQRVHPLRLHERLHAHARGRLVHEVDGLVRQPAVADIAHGERDGLAQRIVRDVQAVVRLEPFAQTAQDQQALLRRGLCNAHGLKAPLERRVLFDILAVLLERRRADDLQLVAPERGLENVRRVDRALGRARADDRVQLVDEENHIPRSLHLVQDALDALFKVAAVLCAREHGRQVHTHNTLVAQVLGHVAVRNALRQPLGHRRLADAGLADEHGVILAAAREDLDGALDLPVAADDRVHLPAGCQLREVAAVLVERFRVGGAARLGPRGRLLRPGLILRPAEHVHDVRVDLVQVTAGRHDDARTGAVRLAEDAHEDVLRANVTVTEPVGVLGG